VDSRPELRFDIAYPERSSRLLIFVKWLLAIPHAFVLGFLGLALFYVVTPIAWVSILVLGRYPRGMWEFALGTLRWYARLNAYVMLQRDEYPPFGDLDYPMTFDLAYPERLSRWKIFVKPFLVIPQFVVLYVLALVLAYVVLPIAWLAILLLGRHPRPLFDFTTGVLRFTYRTSAYLLLLTDAYPPFSLGDDAPPATTPYGYAPASGYAD
jgi:Domain of unknown function (DUF4389)